MLCSQFSLSEADSGVFLRETVNTSKGEDGRGECLKDRADQSEFIFLGFKSWKRRIFLMIFAIASRVFNAL